MSDAYEMRVRYWANYIAPAARYWRVSICGYIYRLYADGLLVRDDCGDPGDESDGDQ